MPFGKAAKGATFQGRSYSPVLSFGVGSLLKGESVRIAYNRNSNRAAGGILPFCRIQRSVTLSLTPKACSSQIQ